MEKYCGIKYATIPHNVKLFSDFVAGMLAVRFAIYATEEDNTKFSIKDLTPQDMAEICDIGLTELVWNNSSIDPL